jgi:dolichol kinase
MSARWLAIAIVATFVLGLLVLGLLTFGPIAVAAPLEEVAACGTTVEPPIQAQLPDGSIIPVTRVEYDIASRTVRLWGNPRIFCDDFEGG